jgi:hypothetical protein
LRSQADCHVAYFCRRRLFSHGSLRCPL